MTRPLAGQRWTFCGVSVLGDFAMLLINDEAHSTRCLVTYRNDRPVRFTYVGAPVLFAQGVAA